MQNIFKTKWVLPSDTNDCKGKKRSHVAGGSGPSPSHAGYSVWNTCYINKFLFNYHKKPTILSQPELQAYFFSPSIFSIMLHVSNYIYFRFLFQCEFWQDIQFIRSEKMHCTFWEQISPEGIKAKPSADAVKQCTWPNAMPEAITPCVTEASEESTILVVKAL